MSLLDDPEKILEKSDEILKLEGIIAEKDKLIQELKDAFDYIHEENARLRKELSNIQRGSWVNSYDDYLLRPGGKVFIKDF